MARKAPFRLATLFALTLGSVAFAQDFEVDTSLVEACLDNISIAREDGVEMEPRDCIGLSATACMAQPGGDSTAGMIECTSGEIDFWDRLLNEAYQQLLTETKGWTPSIDPRVTEDMAPEILLRQMQRDWIAYRDSSCDWDARPWEGGSIIGIIRAGCLLDATAEQTIRLRRRLHEEQGMR